MGIHKTEEHFKNWRFPRGLKCYLKNLNKIERVKLGSSLEVLHLMEHA